MHRFKEICSSIEVGESLFCYQRLGRFDSVIPTSLARATRLKQREHTIQYGDDRSFLLWKFQINLHGFFQTKY